MARSPKTIEIILDNIYEYGDILNGNPYLWTVFFKADGSTLSVNDAGMVDGNCVIFPSVGSHGDLGNQPPEFSSVTVPYYAVGETGGFSDQITLVTRPIPASIGVFFTNILPIPVAPSIQQLLGQVDQAGNFGVVAVLMNQGALPESAVEVGHLTLNTEVESSINDLLRKLGPAHQTITDDDVNGIVANVAKKVIDAIKNDLSIKDDLNAWENGPDYAILQAVWHWDQDLGMQTPFEQYTGPNAFGDWADWEYVGLRMDDFAITGTVTVSDLCPANSLDILFSAFFELLGDPKHDREWHQTMLEFRNEGGLSRRPGLLNWWNIAARYAAHLTGLASKDESFRTSLYNLLKELPDVLTQPQKKISKTFVENANRVLEIVCKSPHAELRKAALTGISLLRYLPHLTVEKTLDLMSNITPFSFRPKTIADKTGHSPR